MSSDIAVSVSNRVPNGSFILTKPSYLITLEENSGKTKTKNYFITIDRPDYLNGFIQVRGVFAKKEMTEETLISNFSSILTSTDKGLFLEMFFPWHKICSMRSLVFKAK